MPPKPRTTTTRKAPSKRRTKRKRVAVRSPISVSLFQCGRCKLKTNNPFKRWGHTCLIGFTPAQRRAARANLEAARKAKRG